MSGTTLCSKLIIPIVLMQPKTYFREVDSHTFRTYIETYATTMVL